MTIEIRIDHCEINIHGADASEILQAIAGLREEAMARFTEVTALLAAMNDVTNALAANVAVVVTNEAAQLAEIQALRDQIAAGQPVTQEQLDALHTTMTARVDALRATETQLRAIANPATPEEPIPDVPPVEGGEGDEGGGEETPVTP